MRACERLMKAVRKVYGEENTTRKTVEEETVDKHHEIKKDKVTRGRKVSDQTSIQTSPVRRKDSVSKKEKFENRQKDLDQDLEKNKQSDENGFGKKFVTSEKPKEALPILKYLKTQVWNHSF